MSTPARQARLDALRATMAAAQAQLEALIADEEQDDVEEQVEACPECKKPWATEGPDYADAGSTRVCGHCNANIERGA